MSVKDIKHSMSKKALNSIEIIVCMCRIYNCGQIKSIQFPGSSWFLHMDRAKNVQIQINSFCKNKHDSNSQKVIFHE